MKENTERKQTADDLTEYRNSTREQERVNSLLRLAPAQPGTLLDIGSRDGYLAKRFADAGWQVTALDLELPRIEDERITCVAGDVTRLQFNDNSFDLVLCAEVLEHITSPGLESAVAEIRRVASCAALIGVPYRQDLRVNCTRCSSCGTINPPWGHVNVFDETRLATLMEPMHTSAIDHVGSSKEVTNFISARLMRFAGHPYGTYMQDEPCIACGKGIGQPSQRTFIQKVATRLSILIERMQQSVTPPRPAWLHMLFLKEP